MKANDRQVAGKHYRDSTSTQHWDFAASNNFDYFQGQITKYVTRWKKKNGIVDLEKALHFLEKYIEVEKEKIKGVSNLINRDAAVIPSRIDTTGQKRPFGYDPEFENK